MREATIISISRLLSLVFVTTAAAVPARADFQNTSWGMSVEEVRRAVPETRANADRGKDISKIGQTALLTAPLELSGLSVRAYFLFDRNEALVSVDVETDPEDCVTMLMAIRQGYGIPEDERHTKIAMSAFWSHTDSGNRLRYLKLGLPGQETKMCQVRYEPIRKVGDGNF